MSQEESRTDLGLIRIHKNAIASVASLAALEIEGVKKISGSFSSNLLGLVGRGNISAIRVDINKREEVKIEIPLFIRYGFNIPDIAGRVQENVRQALEKMTSLSIKEVNINVQGIERN